MERIPARRRRTLSSVVVLALCFLAGCEGAEGPMGPAGPEGSQGPTGPTGPSGEPPPISFATFTTHPTVGDVALAVFGLGEFGEGSTFESFDVSGGTLPSLDDLAAHDVVIAWTNLPPVDAEATGDLLADYVDGGGMVVLAQGAFTTTYEITGRMQTAGYSPFSFGATAGDATLRELDTASLSTPPHPVFDGINPLTWVGGSAGVNSDLSAPAGLGTHTMLATFTNGHNAVAINADESVIGMNIFPDPTDDPVMRLVANAVVYLAGGS